MPPQHMTVEAKKLQTSVSASKGDKASRLPNSRSSHSSSALNLAGWQAAIREALWQHCTNMCHPAHFTNGC